MGEIIKSEHDQLEYKNILLDNRMKVILIENKETESSAVALRVDVGSYNDPDAHPGMAHFLEHLLFMGSKEYPEEEHYSDFVAKNGGHYNAFTEDTGTTYYHEIKNEAFEESLKILAAFFSSPLMKHDCVDKELNAVHNEYAMRVNNDLWRFYTMIKTMAHRDSPFSRFSIGNKETLSGKNTYNELWKFFEKYYSSNLMTLVIYSNKNFDEMIKLAKLFETVKDKNLSKSNYSTIVPPFASSELGKIVKVKSLVKSKTIKVI